MKGPIMVARRRSWAGALAGWLFASALLAPGARAQDTSAPPQASAQPASPGPLLLEPVRDRFVLGPEAKVAEIDGATTALVGGYGGLLFQGSTLLAGAIYALPSGPNGAELTYGGLLAGVVFGDQRRLTYGVRGLVGLGKAELTSSIRFGVPSRPTPRESSGYRGTDATVVREVRFEETFMVLEPQADVILRLSEHWRMAFGVGYLLTNASDYFNDRIDGVTGSVAIVFGGSK
jgi:hypothetical protein